MKYARKSLNEQAATMAATFEMEGKPNLEIFHHNIARKLSKFREYVDEQTRTEEEIAAALAPTKGAVLLYNDEVRMQRLEQLEGMGVKEAMLAYLSTQCVTGFKCENDKEAGWQVVEDKKVELDAYDFIDTMCSADKAGLLDAVCIFADNLAKFEMKDDGAYISKNSMTPEYVALRKRKGWDMPVSKMSLGKLAEQLDEICQMVTFKVAPKMISTDVKYVKVASLVAKSQADKAGIFQMRDEKTILRFIFRAIYTRYHKLPYDWQDSTRGSSKTPLSKGANKDMAENVFSEEFKPTPAPKAGEITLGKASE